MQTHKIPSPIPIHFIISIVITSIKGERNECCAKGALLMDVLYENFLSRNDRIF